MKVMNEVDRGRPREGRTEPIRTVACVDVVLRHDATVDAAASAVGVAVERIRQTVRADDRICPLSTSRLAVEFGASAGGVPAHVLGERLARAVDQGRNGSDASTFVTTSVGVAEPEPHLQAADVTRRAVAAARAGTLYLAHQGGRSRRQLAAVTVDRLLAPGPSAPDRLTTFQAIHRRSIVCLDLGCLGAKPAPLDATVSLPPGTAATGGAATIDLSVLVVDPMGTADGAPGLAALAAVATANQAECRAVTLIVAPGDLPASALLGSPVDLAVVTLDGGWEHAPSSWASGTWGVPAHVTASLRDAGVPVLAMSAGAGAGALASCVAQGAIALYSPDQLPDALRSIGSPSGDELLQAAELNQSERFRALVGLTASERRVLFYLTEGWSAQDITDELVVSLATVRSHIQSVLRKLGVRSQLAAVALANSRDVRGDGSRALT